MCSLSKSLPNGAAAAGENTFPLSVSIWFCLSVFLKAAPRGHIHPEISVIMFFCTALGFFYTFPAFRTPGWDQGDTLHRGENPHFKAPRVGLWRPVARWVGTASSPGAWLASCTQIQHTPKAEREAFLLGTTSWTVRSRPELLGNSLRDQRLIRSKFRVWKWSLIRTGRTEKSSSDTRLRWASRSLFTALRCFLQSRLLLPSFLALWSGHPELFSVFQPCLVSPLCLECLSFLPFHLGNSYSPFFTNSSIFSLMPSLYLITCGVWCFFSWH